MEDVPLLAVTLFGVLPTAQNVLIPAIRYDRGWGIARQSALVTTALSILLMIAIVTLVEFRVCSDRGAGIIRHPCPRIVLPDGQASFNLWVHG